MENARSFEMEPGVIRVLEPGHRGDETGITGSANDRGSPHAATGLFLHMSNTSRDEVPYAAEDPLSFVFEREGHMAELKGIAAGEPERRLG